MWKTGLIAAVCLLASGCKPEGRPDADTAIREMIRRLQQDHRPSGYCESGDVFDNGIRIPYTLWVCAD